MLVGDNYMFYVIRRNKIRLAFSFILFFLSIGILCYLMLCSDISNIQFFILIFLFCCFISKSLYTLNIIFSRIQGNEKNYELVPFLNISNTILSRDFDNSRWKIWSKNNTGFYFYSGDINEIKNLPILINSNVKLKNDFLYRLTTLSEYYFLFIKKDYLGNRNFHDYLKQRGDNKTYALLSDFEGTLSMTVVDIRDAIVDQKILGRELVLDSLVLNSSQLLLSKRKDKYVLKSIRSNHFINGIQINILFVTEDKMVAIFDSIPNYFYSFTDIGDCETVNVFCENQVKRYLKINDINVNLCEITLSCEDVGAPVLVCEVLLSDQFLNRFCKDEIRFLFLDDFLKWNNVDEKILMLQRAVTFSKFLQKDV